YTLLMLDRQLEIMYDMTELTKQTWERMKLLKETRVGYRSTAVQSAEASYLSVQASTVDLKRQIREIENSLTLLMGETAFAIDRGKLEEQQLPSKFSTGVGIQLINNRADVHAAELTLASCFYDINVARSRFYPNITITGTGAFTNNNGLVDPGKILLSAVGSLVQPIFQHGQIVAGLKVAKMKYEQAYNTWQNTILKAGNEVSNALVLYNSSEEKSQIEAKQIAVLRQNVQDTKASYGLNNTNYLEVITAQSSLLNAEISKVTDDFNKVQAVVNLYVALGGGAK
ncbi:MAG: TolC family protein, partial [Prevotella sp.]|nr:TolC family protein [Prevotella sp.]